MENVQLFNEEWNIITIALLKQFLEYLFRNPWNLIKGFIKFVGDKVLGFLKFIIVILLLIYLVSIPLFAFGNLSHELGNLTNKQNGNLSHEQDNYIKYIPNQKIDFLGLMSGILLLLVGLLVIGIFKGERSITILPFEVVPSQEGLNGKAIAELLP